MLLFLGTSIEKEPSEFVCVAAFEPLTWTVAPAIGCLLESLIIFPVMVFCENPIFEKKARQQVRK